MYVRELRTNFIPMTRKPATAQSIRKGIQSSGMCQGYEVAGETKDHTPNAPEEEKRIKAAGGKARPGGAASISMLPLQVLR